MLRSFLLAVVAALLLAAPARAADVSLTGGTVTVAAAPGEANRLTLALSGGVVTVTDTGAAVTAGAGCAPAAAGKATCAITGAPAATVALGDGNDTLVVSGALPITATDGDGNDSVSGGSADDMLIASPVPTPTRAAAGSTRSTTPPGPRRSRLTSTGSPTTARPRRPTTFAPASSVCSAAAATTA